MSAVYIYIQGKNNQHFDKNISATAFINSCQHLQFITLLHFQLKIGNWFLYYKL